jgi:serine O-acetyltransferase
VTLGGTSLEKGKRHPTIGDRVVIGAGAKVLGAITIGEDSRIGANAVVVRSVPPNSVVVGVPGQIVTRSQPHHMGDAPDLDHTSLPDVVGVTLKQLLERVDSLENRLEGKPEQPREGSRAVQKAHVHAPKGEAWEGEDFTI